MTTCHSNGTVRVEALVDMVNGSGMDLLLATTREDYVRIADHLRLLASDVIRLAEQLPEERRGE